ncbi:MAG: hypothetical protein J6Y48_20890, partial [Clostridia bacterium]|nr:hypothetical protein [Clostridia bacterium]
MKRRFFILLTAAVLAFLLLPASVSADPGDPEETKTVTEAINLAADDTSRSGSGWAWDSSTKTLVLNGLDLDLSSAGGYTSGISLAGGAVRIVLQGSNYIRVSGAGH